ncbi:hypothetical protein VNO77_44710 [Canavalia gladiata]|uniref:Non-structural maintenance of chromosomes element 1 homolog n=1 Tax=Canavalia gladiata TaxID=3824 RepID=A0AAN9PQN8_CANGL
MSTRSIFFSSILCGVSYSAEEPFHLVISNMQLSEGCCLGYTSWAMRCIGTAGKLPAIEGIDGFQQILTVKETEYRGPIFSHTAINLGTWMSATVSYESWGLSSSLLGFASSEIPSSCGMLPAPHDTFLRKYVTAPPLFLLHFHHLIAPAQLKIESLQVPLGIASKLLNPIINQMAYNNGGHDHHVIVVYLSGLNWRHHVVIQSLLSRGPLKEEDLHSMFEDLTKENPGTDRKLFDAFVLKINKALTCANFELRGCIDQYDGQVYYGVVNTVSDEHSKLGTKYTVPQIAFYKAIIESIVQDVAANGVISSIDALNLNLDSQVTIATHPQSQGSQPNVSSALKHFTLSQKEKTLHELVRDRWLNLTTDGIIKLGLKSFLDLRGWFRHNDVPSCHVCNEAGIKAELCQNENCSVRIHQYCLKQLFSQRKVAKVCPSCGTLWPYTVPKAEAKQTEDDTEPRQRQHGTGSKQKRHSANRVVDDEVGCSNQDELNECRGSQHGNELARKRRRACGNDNADVRGSGESQSSTTISDTRRITRRSARLM